MTIDDDGLRRLYMVIPGSELAQRLVSKLQKKGIPSQGMSLFAYRPDRLGDLPATVTGLTAGRRRMLMWGLLPCLVGALLGLALMAQGVHWLVLPVLALAGLSLGAGRTHKLSLPADAEPLRAELGRDDILMLVDVRDDQQEQIQQDITEHYPEVRLKGTDPAGAPPFP